MREREADPAGLFAEIARPGTLEEGTPHSRAQNFMAHVGLSMIFALSLGAFGITGAVALVLVVVVGLAWETRGILVAERALKDTCTRKSLLDVVAYALGALVVTSESATMTLLFVALFFVGGYVAAHPNYLKKGEDS